MIKTREKLTYRAFGFNMISSFSLPEIPETPVLEAEADIIIDRTEADLVSMWEEKSQPGSYFVVEDNWVLFHVPETAAFLIKNGNHIAVSPINENKQDHMRLYLLGTCMGVMLMQRNIIPLHGSAIAINGKAYAVVGDSGAGKSTLARAFLKREYQLLSDDIIPVTFTADGQPMLTPAYPHQKLWLESLNEFGQDASELKPIVFRDTKFAVPVTEQFETNVLPLAAVFELVKTDKNEVRVQPIDGLYQFHMLFKHTYRNQLIARSGLLDWHFQTCVKMASHIGVYQLQRPITRFTADELAEIILSTIERGIIKS
ncbi:aldolase [Radiobacillus sp. PE A8.2]|uniref:aldolase n=1 Tax=Radiobacillus sp. PE A8.2 TaxID=3380349 RepID=UPI00388D46D5